MISGSVLTRLAAALLALLAAAPARFALGGFSMGGYVAFEVLRQAPQRVERLALIDTQAEPDTPEATARRHGFLEQSRIGRFHGVQPSLLPNLVHPSRLGDAEVVQPIFDMWKNDRSAPIEFYPAGSMGPEGADQMLWRSGRAWRPID